MKTDPSEAASMCATTLALCSAWFKQAYPDARIKAEVDDDDWRDIRLVAAIEHALTMFRDEHGETDG